MKKVLLSALIVCFGAFVVAACTSSQFTLYKPSDNEPAWRVSVEQRPDLISPKFVCIVNDSAVVESLFELFSSNFEKDGSYRAKPVKMSGFRTSQTIVHAEGSTVELNSTSFSYKIRIFIDEIEVGVFDF